MTHQCSNGPYPSPGPVPGWGAQGPVPPSPGGYAPPGPPGFGPPPGPGGPWGGPPPPPPGRSRKPLIVTLLASLAVFVVVGVVLAIVLGTGGHRGAKDAGSAGDAVKAYLEALARGDADTALSMGLAEPASRKFLTNDALKQQIEHWPIKNIEVLSDSSKSGPGDTAIVKVSADFGGNRSSGQAFAKKRNGAWKLPAAALHLKIFSVGRDDVTSTLNVLGKPLGNDRDLYVFPGYLGLKSVPYVDVQAESLLQEPVPTLDIGQPINIKYEINDAGRQAIQTALATWLAGCLSDPDHFYKCPSQQIDPPINPATVKITGPVDLSGTTQSLGYGSLKATVTGPVRFSFTAETTAGGPATFDSVQNLSGATAVDLAKEPPTVGPAF